MFSYHSSDYNPAKIIEFKQDINQLIDKYLQSESSDDADLKDRKLLEQVATYYNRMKTIYDCATDSEDDNDRALLSDSASSGDYNHLFDNRIYTGNINLTNDDSPMNSKINRHILGFDDDDDNSTTLDERSVDPVLYDSSDAFLFSNSFSNFSSNDNKISNFPATCYETPQFWENFSAARNELEDIGDPNDTDYKSHNLKSIYTHSKTELDFITGSDISYDEPQL